MKIRDVRVDLISAQVPKEKQHRSDYGLNVKVWAAIVIVETDEGLVGYGEARGIPHLQKSIVEQYLRPMLIGQDPTKPEYLWEKMYNTSRVGLSLKFGHTLPAYSGGSRGETMCAISGVDIALWDLYGKSLGLPVYKLLGGGVRDRITAYASGGWKSAEHAGEEALSYVREGYQAVKMRVGLIDDPVSNSVKRVEAVRKAVGDEIGIMVDAHGSLSVSQAKVLAKHIEQYDISWFEEPLSPDNRSGCAEVRANTCIPIATGENDMTRFEFKELIELHAADILQPDVSVAGGITEMRRIGALASAFGLRVEPHVWGSNILAAASLQLSAAMPNCTLFEVVQSWNPILFELSDLSLKPEADGCIAIPNKPGLGIELDPDYLRKYPYDSSPRMK
jgi:D-galactarolactone cycloisomerase